MARISEVIHVKYNGEVQECALFDASSDIPTNNPRGVYSKELALNGSKIYAAIIADELDHYGDSADFVWMYDNLSTPLNLFWDGDAHRLLTTPYFVRPLVDHIYVAAMRSVYIVETLLSTNGSVVVLTTPDTGFIDGNSTYIYIAENTSTSARDFTVTLTVQFADGSTQQITFSGTQEAASNYITVAPTTASVGHSGGTTTVSVTSNTSWKASSGSSWLTVSPASGTGDGTVTLTSAFNTGTSSRSATVTFTTNDGSASATVTVSQGAVSPSITLTSGSTADAVAGGYAEFAFTVNSDTTSVRVSCSVWADGGDGAGVSYWQIGSNAAHSSDGEEAVTAGSSFTLRVFLGNTRLNDEIEVNVTPCNGSVTGTIRHCYINAS